MAGLAVERAIRLAKNTTGSWAQALKSGPLKPAPRYNHPPES